MQRIDRPFLLERAVDFIQSIVRYLKLCRLSFVIGNAFIKVWMLFYSYIFNRLLFDDIHRYGLITYSGEINRV